MNHSRDFQEMHMRLQVMKVLPGFHLLNQNAASAAVSTTVQRLRKGEVGVERGEPYAGHGGKHGA